MKIRYNFVSNSSSCSFIICKEFLNEEQIKKITKWYKEKDRNGVYMDDLGNNFDDLQNYLIGTISYVKNDFIDFCKTMKIEKEKICFLEN